MLKIAKIEVDQNKIWGHIHDDEDGNVSIFDPLPHGIPDVMSEIIIGSSATNYEEIKTLVERELADKYSDNTVLLDFVSTSLVGDLYLQHRLFYDKHNNVIFRELHGYRIKESHEEETRFVLVADSVDIKYLNIFLEAFLGGDLREKCEYDVFGSVKGKYDAKCNSVLITSKDKNFQSFEIDAYQARVILDTVAVTISENGQYFGDQ